MTKEQRLVLLKQIEEQIYVCSLESTLQDDLKSAAIHSIIEEETERLEQEPCDDEYIKVPKKALKHRTAEMVAYNVEWLKNHFDMERAIICGAKMQEVENDKEPGKKAE